jgi:hypothetical protein
MLNLYYQIINQKLHFNMNQEETTTAPAPSKKQVRKEISEKLEGALAQYKQELGEKKLATRVKKVSKLISKDLLKISKKQRRNSKNGAPKAAKKGKKTSGKPS